MLPNSSFRGGGGGGSYSGLGLRKVKFKHVIKQVMRKRLTDQFMLRMESFLRTTIREEVERVIQLLYTSERLSLNLIGTTGAETRLQLRFVNTLPQAIFTENPVLAIDGSPIMVELIDAHTNTRVTSGPLSSLKIELIALDGDFTQEDWHEELFNIHILRQREGRRPLLTGDLNLTLKDGLGVVNGDINFTDNSSWIRSRRFRLGARISQRRASESRIKEAKSEPFVCKDHRGESYKKHETPLPEDAVWRLVKIAKDGAFHARLAKNGINTVKDFLRVYVIKPNTLRNILGDRGGISSKVWDAIIAHALRCVLDENELYVYNGVAHRALLLLNSIYKVIAISFGDQSFQPVDQLSFHEKLVLDELKLEAYKNLSNLIAVNGGAGPSRPLPSPQDEPFGVMNSGLHQVDFQITHHDQPGSLIDFGQAVQPERTSFDQPPASISHVCGTINNHPIQLNGPFQVHPALRNSFRRADLVYGGESSYSMSDSEGDLVHTVQFGNEGFAQPHVFMTTWSPGPTSWAQANGLCLPPEGEAEVVGVFPAFDVHARIVRSKAGWCKIRAALKLRAACRCAAARRRASVH